MVVTIGGKRLWRAVDSEGEVLDLVVQPRRDKAAAVRLMRVVSRRHYPPHAQNPVTPVNSGDTKAGL